MSGIKGGCGGGGGGGCQGHGGGSGNVDISKDPCVQTDPCQTTPVQIRGTVDPCQENKPTIIGGGCGCGCGSASNCGRGGQISQGGGGTKK